MRSSRYKPEEWANIPAVVGLDWFYMSIYPLLDYLPGLTVWILLVTATALLLLVPWLPPGQRNPVAVVNLDNCNGCSRCATDYPFSAITMEPRSDGSAYEHEAVVDASHCTSCGICAGACPTATPFRRRSDLSPGVELPDQPIKELREKTITASDRLGANAKGFVCCCP